MAAARATREPFEGDVLTRYPEGGKLALRVQSRFPKTGWRPRQPGDQLRADHPGSAVQFEGRHYEVLRCRLGGEQGGRSVYDLTLWDDCFVLPTPVEYSRESTRRLYEAHREREREITVAWGLRLASPLVSLLPARDQLQIENRFGLHAGHNTYRWSLVSMGLYGTAFGLGLREMVIGGNGLLVRLFPLVALLTLESILRYGFSARIREPIGSLPVVLPIETARLVTRLAAADHRREVATMRAQEWRFDDFDQARDEVEHLVVKGADGQQQPRLCITSLLPKPHWTLMRTGVRIGDAFWLPIEREEIEVDGEPRYRFLLEPLEPEFSPPKWVEFVPEEVQQIHRERLRRQYDMWVQSLAMLWGFLDEPRKRKLESAYDFDIELFTRASLAVAVALGGVLTLTAVRLEASGQATGIDAIAFLVGLVLLLDSFLRWREVGAGKFPGSVFAPLLHLVIDPMLRVGPKVALGRLQVQQPPQEADGVVVLPEIEPEEAYEVQGSAPESARPGPSPSGSPGTGSPAAESPAAESTAPADDPYVWPDPDSRGR